MAVGTGFQAPQQAQFEDWIASVQTLCERLGQSFVELKENQQREIQGQASEIAKLRGEFQTGQEQSLRRFHAIAEHYHRGGDYRGPFNSREEAASFGRLVAFVATGDQSALLALQRAGMGPAKGSEGGYLMPDVLVPGIIRNVEQYGVFESDVPPSPVAGETGGETKRIAGLTVYHPGLGQSASESQPNLGRVNFSLIRWATLTLVDRWMLNENLSVALGDFVAQEIALALAYAEDLYGFMGDGTSTYGRVTGAFKRAGTNQLTVTADSGDDTFAEVIAKSTYYLGKVMGTLPKWAHQFGPKWYMHMLTFFSYLGVRDTAGQPIANILQADRPTPFMLMGYPVQIVQVAPSVTAVSTVFAVFGALARGWKLYRHVNGVEIRVSEHYKFAEGQVAIAGDVVQDIVESDPNAYVQLATAAS